MQTAQTITEYLRNNGYSATKPRRAVFEALSSARQPLSIRELYLNLSGRLDRTSVYRTVTLFEKLRVIERVQIGWKYKLELSSTFQEHHHHLYCTSCGKLVALHDEATLEDAIAKIASNHGFLLTAHSIELQGVCASCRSLAA